MPTAIEAKKLLTSAGLLVYRTREPRVHVAERARENLLMDSGISIDVSGPSVMFTVRAQKGDFPGVPADELVRRARGLAAEALGRGYRELRVEAREVNDPGDATRTLDVFYEIFFEKPVASLDDAIDEVRWALSIPKAATP